MSEGVRKLPLQVTPGFLYGVFVGDALGVIEEYVQKSAHAGTGLRAREKDVGVEENPHRLSL